MKKQQNVKKPKFTFIDLFAGIGGMRQAFEARGGKCVFSSEWDKFAQQTYQANFGEKPHGDITQIPSSVIPRHDILIAGFPCQPFSHAGLKEVFWIHAELFSLMSPELSTTESRLLFYLKTSKGSHHMTKGKLLPQSSQHWTSSDTTLVLKS